MTSDETLRQLLGEADNLQVALQAMAKLSDKERLRVMENFCHGCGTPHLPCHCLRDE